MMDLPIACTLTDAERRGTRAALLPGLLDVALEVVPLPTGYRARFSGTAGIVQRIADVLERERGCCRFLAFVVEAAANGGDVTLSVTGPPGTREFLDGLVRA